MLNALPAMVGYWDSELKQPDGERRLYRVLRDLAGGNARDPHPRPARPRALREEPGLHRGRPAGEKQLFDREILTPAGEVRYTQASYVPDVVDGKAQGFFVLVTDITERRRIEEEIQRSRSQLADAERVARLGSWELDIPANRITCSEGLFEIYGITAEEFDEHYEAGSSRYVHPDDRDRVEHEMRKAVESVRRSTSSTGSSGPTGTSAASTAGPN